MKIIVVANGKGGVGKTTSTLCLAAVAAAAGFRVLLVDVDSQGSAVLIANQSELVRKVELPFDYTQETDPAYLRTLRAQAAYDIVLVDTPGSLEGDAVFAAVIQQADFVVLPSFADLMSLTRVITTVKKLTGLSDVSYKVLLTRVEVQRGAVRNDAEETLKDAGVLCFAKPIRKYTLYDDIQNDGTPITEAPGRWRMGANALNDYQAAWNEVTSTWLRAA